MLRRQRILFNNLKTPPPPRRSNNVTAISPSLASQGGGTTTSAFHSASKQDLEATSDPLDLSSSPGMLSAMSQINQSSAFLAAKAFLIATGLVAVGGVAFTWAVKTTLGVENVFSSYILFHCFFSLNSDFFCFLFCLVGSGVWSKDTIDIPNDSPRFKITTIQTSRN